FAREQRVLPDVRSGIDHGHPGGQPVLKEAKGSPLPASLVQDVAADDIAAVNLDGQTIPEPRDAALPGKLRKPGTHASPRALKRRHHSGEDLVKASRSRDLPRECQKSAVGAPHTAHYPSEATEALWLGNTSAAERRRLRSSVPRA